MDKEKGLPRQILEKEAAKTYMEIYYPPQTVKLTDYERRIVELFVQYGITELDFIKSFRATKGAKSYWKEGSMREGNDIWTKGENEDNSVLIVGFRIFGIPVGVYACKDEGLYDYDPESYWLHFAILSNDPKDRIKLDGYCDTPFGFSNLTYFRDTRDAIYSIANAFGIDCKGL